MTIFDNGQRIADRIIDEIGDSVVSELLDNVDEHKSSWEQRPKSFLVKQLMLNAGKDSGTMAKYLGCKKTSFNNKLSRDSFDFDDMVIIAEACGYHLSFVRNKPANDSTDELIIKFDEYYAIYDAKPENKDKQVLRRFEEINKDTREVKYQVYLKLKKELERMQLDYGFSD